MAISYWLSTNLYLEYLNRFLCLAFLVVVFFAPYQSKWFSIAPQTILLFLGMGLMILAVFFQKLWKEVRLDWPFLLLIICLIVSVIYHQSFNMYARAYALSIATYIWLRFSLSSKDIPFLVEVAKLFIITHSILMIGQIFFGKSWYVAQYLANLGPGAYGVPLGFMDMFLTASMVPALLLLFLLGMQIKNFISSSLILDCCYFITPFAILVTSSRTAIVGFLGALITLIIMNAKFFRNTWRPIILILCGFILTLIVIPKLPKFHDHHVYGSVFEAKLVEPFLYPINKIQSNQFDEFNKKKVIDDSTMSRLLLWRAILQELVDKPDLLLMGIGLGQSHTSFKYMMANGQLNAKIFGNDIISPHNSFIELFYEGGIFCLCALIIFIASRLFNRDNLRSPWFYALIMTFLMMLFFDMLRMRFFWIMLALVEVPIFIRKSHVSKISGVSSHLRGVGK